MRQIRLLALLLFVLLVAPLAAPYKPTESNEQRFGLLHAPTLLHPFGTDNLARDLLSRVLVASQASLELALSAVAVALIVGTAVGAVAAFKGGWYDAFLMRGVDLALAVPRLLVLLAVAGFFPDLPWFALPLLLGLTGWFDIARLTRSDLQGLLHRDFVLASEAMGVGAVRLLVRHLVPHLVPTLLVVGTLAIGSTIALESGLAVLGVGLDPTAAPTLGTLLHDALIDSNYWWLAVFPGATIVLIMLATNALGDALRERFAPQQFPA